MDYSFKVITGKQVDKVIRHDISLVKKIIKKAYILHGMGETENPDSYFLCFPQKPKNRIIALPAYLGGEFAVAGIKWISSWPDNVLKGIPRASATLLLNDYETGYPFACLEASIISATRTASSAVLAAEVLNQNVTKVKSLSIIGTGLIAKHIYRHFIGNGWEIEELRLFDKNVEYAKLFQDQVIEESKHKDVIVDKVIEVALKSDIVAFVTVASEPHVVDSSVFCPGQIILNISLRDLSPEIILSADNYADDIEHVMKANTSVHITEQKVGNRNFMNGSLYDLLSGKVKVNNNRLNIFSPFGLGVLDLAVGKHIYDCIQNEVEDVADFFFEKKRI
jgi:2,3-diaminopropionate biosynthesis protein SbnB